MTNFRIYIENIFKTIFIILFNKDIAKPVPTFEPKWTFPETKMNKLYKKLPNKDDIDMRCLSVEYGCLYHALWVCDKDGWRET